FLGVEPQEFLLLQSALIRHREACAESLAQLMGRLWDLVGAEAVPPGQRFRAACALAGLVPHHPKWPTIAAAVADQLVREPSLALGAWIEALRPVGGWLREFLRPRIG